MKDLNDYIKSNMKFLKIEDGQAVTLIYKGYSVVADRFNGGETVSYLFQFPDNDKTISWQQKSSRTAMQMNKVGVGNLVQIERRGTSFETKYKITPLGQSMAPMAKIEGENQDEVTPF